MTDRKKNLAAIIAIVIIAGSAGIFLANENKTQSSGKSSESKVKEPFILRFQDRPGSVRIIEIADKLGYLKEEGIVLKSVGTYIGGPEELMALSSGGVDVGFSNLAPIINAINSGIKFKMVVPSGTALVKNVKGETIPNGGLVVLKKSGINSAKDLVGKKIGVNVLGAQAENVLREYFQQNGVNIKDVQLLVVPSANHYQALKQGQIDASYQWSQFFYQQLEDNDIKLLLAESEITGDIAGTGQVFTEDFIKKNPEVVSSFVKAYVKAWDWAQEHPKELQEISKEIIQKQGGNTELAKYTYPPSERKHALLNDNDIQLYIDWQVKYGKLKDGVIKPSDVYTNEFNPYFNK